MLPSSKGFKLILNTDYYKKENNVWLNKSEDETYMKEKLEDTKLM